MTQFRVDRYNAVADLENCQWGRHPLKGRTFLLQGRPVGRASPVPKEQQGGSKAFFVDLF